MDLNTVSTTEHSHTSADIFVVKFGGSSLATADGFRAAATLLLSDRRRHYAVVSAPGIAPHPQCEAERIKVTDLLKDGRPSSIQAVCYRFLSLSRDLGFPDLLKEDLKTLPSLADRNDRAALISRGEYLSAKLFAALCNRPFLDSSGLICFDKDGRCNLSQSTVRLRKAFQGTSKAVLPGFYGSDADGNVRLFSRGGSDTTGALAAAAASAALYENRTDVDGIYAADPRLFPKKKPPLLRQLSYARMQELARLGFGVLQEDSLRPVMEQGIPLRLCSSFHPDQPGTLLSMLPCEPEPYCIAGKDGFLLLEFPADRLLSLLQSADECHISLRGWQVRDGRCALLLSEKDYDAAKDIFRFTAGEWIRCLEQQALLTATGPLGARRILLACQKTGAPLHFFRASPAYRGDFSNDSTDLSFLRDAPFRESPLLCTDETFLFPLLQELAAYF